MPDKYRILREKVERVCKELLGKSFTEALEITGKENLYLRMLSADGKGCMITADVRMDRIGIHLKDGKIVSAEGG